MRVASGILLVLFGAVPATAQTSPKAAAGIEAYRALNAEYTAAVAVFQKAFQAAKTTEEQQKVFQDKHPRPAEYAPRFMAMAQKYPESPIAVDALVWVVTHPVEPTVRASNLRERALDLLQRNHIRDEKLGKLCTHLVLTIDSASEDFLRKVLDKSPVRGAQARACATLAQNLKYRGRLIPRLKASEEAVKEYEHAWGKPAVAALLKQDSGALLTQSEKMFERVEDKFGTIKHPVHGSLAGLARANLLSLRRPVELDKAAPEIEGVDVAGNKLKLSDSKGKVVLLDFWAYGLPSCQVGLPIERALLKRLAGKPFVVLGVNADTNREALAKTLESEKIPWRSWYDGGFTGGPIATRWDVEVWPTLFLIDAKGVVRKRFFGWEERKAVEEAIDDLVSKAK